MLNYKMGVQEKRDFEDALIFLNLSDNINKEFSEDKKHKKEYTRDAYKWNNINRKEFDGAQFLGFSADKFTPALLEPKEDGYWFFDEHISPDVIWPIDVRTIFLDEDKRSYTLTRVHSVPEEEKKQIRKHYPLIAPYMLCIKSGFLHKDSGKYGSNKWFASFVNGKWVMSHPDSIGGIEIVAAQNPKTGNTLHTISMCKWAMGIALTNHYHWRVEIGYEGHLKISVITDPTGIREVFKLRDIPAGRRRRAALRHWVRSHARQNRYDEEASIFVRQHLRADTLFKWEGLECKIIPSKHDLILNEKLKIQRKLMG